ncbi:MAG: hypothetical protein WC277_03605 [Bacilli bacterium]
MNDLNRVVDALRNADAAGDEAAARRLAAIAKDMRDQQAPSALSRASKQIGAGMVAPIAAGVDAIHGVTKHIPGFYKGDEPFMGSKWAESHLGVGGEPETTLDYAARGVGEVSGLLLPMGVTTKLLTRGTGLVAKIAQSVYAAMVSNPALTMGSEVSAGAGAGVGRKVGEESDIPAVKAGAELVGGVAGGVVPTGIIHAPTALAWRGGKHLLKKVSLPFSKSGSQYRAGEFLKSKVPSPEGSITELGIETIGDLPPVVQAGENRLMNLHKVLMDKDPIADHEMIETLSKSAIKLESEMRKLGYGSSELLADVSKKRIAALQARMDTRVLEATQRAQDKLNKLPVAMRQSKESTIVRNEIERVMREEKSKVDALWGEVPKDMKTGVSNTRSKFNEIMGELAFAQRTDIPAVLSRDPIINNKELTTTTIKEMQGLRSKLLENARIARKNGHWNRARISDEMADAILEDMTGEVRLPRAEGVTAPSKKAAPYLLEEAKKYKSAEEFVEGQRGIKIIDGRLSGEDIARANADGTITVDKEKFYGHSTEQQADILEHEYAHFIESEISPEFKAELFDNKDVMGYRGRNINEKLANMIQDGTLPKIVTDKFPDLPKTKSQLTDIWNEAHKAVAPQKLESLKIALQATRDFKETFNQGVVGKVLGYDKTGAPRVDMEAVLDSIIGKKGIQGAANISKVPMTPEIENSMKRYVTRSFADYSLDSNGVINPAKAQKWMQNNEDVLDRFTDLRTQFSDASEAQKIATQTKATMDARKKALQDPRVSVASRFIETTDLGTEIDAVFKAKNPARMTNELVRQARKDPSGQAIEGVRASMVDYILEKSAKGGYNELGEKVISGNDMMGFINKSEGVLRQVFTPEQMGRMKRIASEYSKIQKYVGASGRGEDIEMKDFASNALRMASRVVGARVGGKIGAGTSGGSIQAAGIMSGRAKAFMTWLTKNRAEALLHDAILSPDPQLLQALLLPLDKPQTQATNLRILNDRLNVWLLGAGSRVMDDIIKEEEE